MKAGTWISFILSRYTTAVKPLGITMHINRLESGSEKENYGFLTESMTVIFLIFKKKKHNKCIQVNIVPQFLFYFYFCMVQNTPEA
jgi:hypothetical protein